jgi:hypothetical protein
MPPEDQAQFDVDLRVRGVADVAGAATSLQELKAQADKSQEAIRVASSSLRLLRGNSDEVKVAQGQLKAQLDQQRAALSAANLEVVKRGSSLRQLGEEERKAAQSGLDSSLLRLFGVSRETRLAIKEFSSGVDVASVAQAGAVAGALALAAAIAAVTVAAVAGGIALSRWAFEAANVARNQSIARQAIAGSQADSERMGDQIDLLRRKVPLATEEFSELYRQIRTTLDNSYVSGPGILNTVTLLGSATAAAGKEASSKIEALVKRGKDSGRFGITPGSEAGGLGGMARGFGAGELAGTGIQFDQVAAALAAQENISIEKARVMLVRHTVEINKGIQAMTTAAGAAYGDTLARKLISADVIAQRFRDDLTSLARGAIPPLEDFLRGLSKIENVFSTTTTSGYALKQIVTSLSTVLFGAAAGTTPTIVTALRQSILWATRLTSSLLDVAIGVKRALNDPERVARWGANFKIALDAVSVAAAIAVGYLAALTISVAAAAAPWVALGAAILVTAEALQKASEAYQAWQSIQGFSATDLGKRVDREGFGAVNADLDAKANALRDQRRAQRARDEREGNIGGGTGVREIEAPAHAAGGLVMRPAPGELFASVAPGERILPAGRGAGGAGGGGRASVTVNFTLHVSGGKDPPGTVAAIQGSSFLADLTKAIEEVLDSAGVPKQAVPG